MVGSVPSGKQGTHDHGREETTYFLCLVAGVEVGGGYEYKTSQNDVQVWRSIPRD
jgi:hypothetical protein